MYRLCIQHSFPFPLISPDLFISFLWYTVANASCSVVKTLCRRTRRQTKLNRRVQRRNLPVRPMTTRGVSTALRTTVIDMALIGDLWIVISSVRHIAKESASRKLLIRARDWQRSSTFTCRKCFNKYSTYTTKMIRAEDMEVNRRTVLALRVTERGL